MEINNWFIDTLLSNELIDIIFNHLDFRSIQSVSMVCKLWNSNTWRHVKSIELTDTLMARSSRAHPGALQVLSRLQPLQMLFMLFPGAFIEDKNADSPLIKMTNLVGLTVLKCERHIDKSTTEKILTSFTRLTSLYLPTDVDLKVCKITRLTMLRELRIYPQRKELDWIDQLPKLTSLDLTRWPKHSSYTMEKCTTLKHLTIRDFMYEYELEDILGMTNLESLMLYNIDYHSCLASLTNLTKLGVHRLRGEYDLPQHIDSLFVYFLPAMRPSFSSLKALHIGYLHSLPIDDAKFLSSLPQLQSLTLPDYEESVPYLTNLTHLRFEYGIYSLNDKLWSPFVGLSNLQVLEFSDEEGTTPIKVAEIFPLKGVLIRRCVYIPVNYLPY